MYELSNIAGHSWLVSSWTNIGIIENNGFVYCVDSGNDKEAGRKLNKIISENNWQLKGIINTHSHADHIGGNDYLQRMYSCSIFAPPIETAFIQHPKLESSFLYGGFPYTELRSKFFEAKPSTVTNVLDENARIDGLTIIPLPGHSFDMIGILTDDSVLYLGDTLFGEEILQKYKIPFMCDVAQYVKTIEKLKTIKAKYYVPSHGNIQTDITVLADINIAYVKKIEYFILDLLRTANSFDKIFQALCNNFTIKLDYAQYVLAGSTLRSFLSYLYDEKKIKYFFDGNMMYWQQN